MGKPPKQAPPKQVPPPEILAQQILARAIVAQQMPPQDDPPDFELSKYELDRAHELELNKFAHALEVERLKILQLVNGGAFTVLAVFATGLVRSPGCSPALAILAGVSWMLGLGAAAWATQRELNRQGMYNKAYRLRRNAVEWRGLGAIHDKGLVAAMLPPFGDERRTAQEDAVTAVGRDEAEKEKAEKAEADVPEPVTDESYQDAADIAFYQGKDASQGVTDLAVASILLFMLGGSLLAASLAFADPAQMAAVGKAAR